MTWAPERVEQLRSLRADGLSIRDAAKAMGVSYAAAWGVTLRRDMAKPRKNICCPVCDREMNIPERQQYGPWYKSQSDLLLKLQSLGMRNASIGKILGTGVCGIDRQLSRIRKQKAKAQ